MNTHFHTAKFFSTYD
jgi:hypothetical protein